MAQWEKVMDLNWHSVGRMSRKDFTALAKRFDGLAINKVGKPEYNQLVYLGELFIYTHGIVYARPTGINMWPELVRVARIEGIIN